MKNGEQRPDATDRRRVQADGEALQNHAAHRRAHRRARFAEAGAGGLDHGPHGPG
jgi:hypothetical protein